MFGRLMKFIWQNNKWRLTAVALGIIISALSSTVATVFMQKIIDECITPGITLGFDAVWGRMKIFLSLMLAVYAVGIAGAFTFTRIMAKITQGTLCDLRQAMFKRMESLPIKYFDTHPHGDIMSTYTNDTDAIRQLIGQSLPVLFQSALSISAMIFVMLYFSLWMSLGVFAVIFLMSKITKSLGGKSAKYMIAQQKSMASEEGFVEEMITGQKVIKVFCHEEEGKEQFRKLNQQLFEDGEKANKFGNILMPILGNIGNLMYVMLAVLGGTLVYFKVPNICLTGISPITIGIITSFLGMSRQLSQTVGQMSAQISMITMGLAGAGRVFELIDREPEDDGGNVVLVNGEKTQDGRLRETDRHTGIWAWKEPGTEGKEPVYTELKGDLRLEHVDFGYVPEKTVLHDISLFAKPGQKIAFVGATGAGKTTITNLINRFYDIQKGSITYDGIDISRIRKADLRSSFGMVLQEVNLFTGTVMDNIRYGKPDATDEECIEAAKLANAHDFIMRLPEEYNTMLTGNGASLSQGQKQLISIARAAVADPPAMILDEATSSIDTRTESLVQAGMDNLMNNRTVFVIAHRLSTIQNSKAIMVMDQGKIIERGKHSQLIQEKHI